MEANQDELFQHSKTTFEFKGENEELGTFNENADLLKYDSSKEDLINRLREITEDLKKYLTPRMKSELIDYQMKFEKLMREQSKEYQGAFMSSRYKPQLRESCSEVFQENSEEASDFEAENKDRSSESTSTTDNNCSSIPEDMSSDHENPEFRTVASQTEELEEFQLKESSIQEETEPKQEDTLSSLLGIDIGHFEDLDQCIMQAFAVFDEIDRNHYHSMSETGKIRYALVKAEMYTLITVWEVKKYTSPLDFPSTLAQVLLDGDWAKRIWDLPNEETDDAEKSEEIIQGENDLDSPNDETVLPNDLSVPFNVETEDIPTFQGCECMRGLYNEVLEQIVSNSDN